MATRLNQVSEADERLLIEAAQQDPSRFAELYELHFHRIYAYISRRVRNRAEAQDLTAHVFQQALANLEKFRWRGAPFSSWLYRIAANAIADYARKLPRESNPETTSVSTADTEGDFEKSERRACVYQAIESLPDDQKRVIVMRFGDEKSIREIATELGRSEGAVKQLQFRALENLRGSFSEKANG